jgi:hypothetical protein
VRAQDGGICNLFPVRCSMFRCSAFDVHPLHSAVFPFLLLFFTFLEKSLSVAPCLCGSLPSSLGVIKSG